MLTAWKIQYSLSRVTQEVSADETRMDVEPSDTESVVVVPELCRPLLVRVVVNLLLPVRPLLREPIGKPGEWVAVAARLRDDAVQVNEGPNLGELAVELRIRDCRVD